MLDTEARTAVLSETPGHAGPERVTEASGFSARHFFLPSAVVLGICVAGVVYIHLFAFDTALDSTLPVYARYWYSFLAVELLVLLPIWQFILVRLSKTRCGVCADPRESSGGVDPAHEMVHIWTHLSLIAAVVLCCNLLFGLVATHDGPWHQSTFRDSALTPVHLLMFYGVAPMMVSLIAATYIYGRTRLPAVWPRRTGVPFAYALWGGCFALTAVFASLNEFGHTEWIFEERISQAVHLPFLLAVFGLAASYAIAAPDLRRMRELRER